MCWECLHFTIALWLLFPSLVFHRHGFFTALFMMQVDIFVSGKFKLEISRALNFFSSSNPITNKIAPLNYFCEWVDRARRKAVLIKWTNIKFRCQVHFDPYFKKKREKIRYQRMCFYLSNDRIDEDWAWWWFLQASSIHSSTHPRVCSKWMQCLSFSI